MGSASTELGPVLGLDVPSTGVAGTAEGNGWSVESLLDQAAAAAHKHHEPSTPPQQTGLDGGPVSYSWSLHLPLPLPMFYRLYGASEGKDLLAKAKTRIPPVPGTPFDLILGVTVRVCEPDSPSFPPLPPLSSSLVPACLTPCPFTAPHRATDSILHPAFLHSLTKCHVLGVDLRHEEGSSGVLGGGAPVTTSLLCLHPMHDGYDILLVPESCLTFSILWGHLRHELWGAPCFNAFLVLGPGLLTKPMVTRTPPPLPDGLLPTPQPQEVWGDLEPRREASPTQEGEGEAWQHDRYSPHDDHHRTDQPRDHRRGRDSYVVGEKRGRDERRAYSPPHDKTREPLIKFNESRAARDSCVFARECIRHQSGRCPAKLHPGDPGYVHPSRVLCGFGRSCVHLRKGQCKHVHLEPPLDEDYD